MFIFMQLATILLSLPVAFDLKIIHPLNSANILEASLISGSTAEKGGKGKHRKNDDTCNARGWSCIPPVVEVYGGWGHKATTTFARLSKLLGLCSRRPSTTLLNELYCHL